MIFEVAESCGVNGEGRAEGIQMGLTKVRFDDEFQRLADERWASVLTKSKTVSWEEAKAYLVERARGERPTKPAARKLER